MKATQTASGGSIMSVPVINRRPWSQISLVLNVFPLPGLGNIVAGVKAGHTPTTVWGVILAVADIITITLNYVSPATWVEIAVFAIWALSIIWGIRIFRASR